MHKSKNKPNLILFVISGILLILLDQFAKYEIRTGSGFYICNKGVAFGFSLAYAAILIGVILLFLIIFNLKLISNFKFQISNYSVAQIIPFILILSGAVSNIFDRLIYGCVIDYINLHPWPVFNLADTYISLGGILIMYNYFFNL